MSKSTCVIVIPVHQSGPSAYELISFRQCFSILGSHPIVVLAPEGLDLARYKQVVPSFETVFIDGKWQSDLSWYNKLKRSRFFYNLFRDYEFLLTYELDAFVFRDDLEYWCKKGYDYIGAPWFEGFWNPPANARIVGVGNSGFSLRKIQPIRHILANWFYKNPHDYASGPVRLLKAYLKAPYRWLKSRSGENYTVQNNYPGPEDMFFAREVPSHFKDFKVAPIEDALKFSFEVKPEYLFELNGNELPMGCHAWWKYNFPFWKPFIEAYGYKL